MAVDLSAGTWVRFRATEWHQRAIRPSLDLHLHDPIAIFDYPEVEHLTPRGGLLVAAPGLHAPEAEAPRAATALHGARWPCWCLAALWPQDACALAPSGHLQRLAHAARCPAAECGAPALRAL